MANTSLTQLVEFINQQVNKSEKLASHLSKAQALAEVAMSNGFLEQAETTQRNYLWALKGLLMKAGRLNEHQITEGMRCVRQFSNNPPTPMIDTIK
jgi:hypothetical protein